MCLCVTTFLFSHSHSARNTRCELWDPPQLPSAYLDPELHISQLIMKTVMKIIMVSSLSFHDAALWSSLVLTTPELSFCSRETRAYTRTSNFPFPISSVCFNSHYLMYIFKNNNYFLIWNLLLQEERVFLKCIAVVRFSSLEMWQWSLSPPSS